MLSKKAFTLVELLAVITLMGILVVIAIVGVSDYITKSYEVSYKNLSGILLNQLPKSI